MKTLIENFRRECERIANGGNFSETPMEFRVPDLNMLAVKKCADNLRLVPRQHISRELAKEAVSRDGAALRHVPPEAVSAEICRLAVENSPEAFRHVPAPLKSRELCGRAFELWTQNIREIPESLVTREMAEKAITADGSLLSASSIERFVDGSLCLLAIKNGAPLSIIPRGYRTYELCLLAARNEGPFVPGSGIPKEFLTKEFWTEACKGNLRNLRHFPRKDLDYGLCLEIVRESRSRFNPLMEMPPAFRTAEMLEAVVNGACPNPLYGLGSALISRLVDKRLAELIAERKSASVPLLPKKFQTEEMWLKFLDEYKSDEERLDCGRPLDFTSIPPALRTPEVCAAFLRKAPVWDGAVIPRKSRTKEVCLLFAENTRSDSQLASAIRFIPIEAIDTALYNAVASMAKHNSHLAKAWRTRARKAGVNPE